MEFLKIILTAIIIVMLAVGLIGLQMVSVFNKTFLQPSFYEKVADAQAFYGQLRQLIFRLINRSLPNGREGMPYIQQALTENWLKGEVGIFMDGFFMFIRGSRDQPPILPFFKLKEKVVQSIDGGRTWEEKQRMVQYWFDPLPDQVRLQDFLSINAIWSIRKQVAWILWMPWIFAGLSMLLLGLLYVVTLDWKQVGLWMAAAMMAAGIQVIVIGIGLQWIFYSSTLIMELQKMLIAFEIPEGSAGEFLAALERGFTTPLSIWGSILAIVGGLMIYVLPIRERSLTLVK